MRRTKDMFLVYRGEEELVVNGYTDTSFQTDVDDSMSQSGYVIMLNGDAISWKSSKQDMVAHSTMEAEYYATVEASIESVWIKQFITDLGVVPSVSSPLDLYSDNSGTIAIAKEPRNHQKTKHFMRWFHLIRQFIERGDINLCRIHMDMNVADPLTKPLT